MTKIKVEKQSSGIGELSIDREISRAINKDAHPRADWQARRKREISKRHDVKKQVTSETVWIPTQKDGEVEYLELNTKYNACTQSVTDYFGVTGHSEYLQNMGDVFYCLSLEYYLEGILNLVNPNYDTTRADGDVEHTTVGRARSTMKRFSDANPDVLGYVIEVDEHVFLCGRDGYGDDGVALSLVDTNPRKRDSRTVMSITAVTPIGKMPPEFFDDDNGNENPTYIVVAPAYEFNEEGETIWNDRMDAYLNGLATAY